MFLLAVVTMELQERDDIDKLLFRLQQLYADANFDSKVQAEVKKVIEEYVKNRVVDFVIHLLRSCYDSRPELGRNICKRLVLQKERKPVDTEKVALLLFILSNCDREIADAVRRSAFVKEVDEK